MEIIFKEELPDAGEYFKLFEKTGWNEKYKLTEDELLSGVRNSYYVVSAYDNDKLVGFGRLVSDGFVYAMIYEMIVHPGYQGNGIGKTILNMLMKKCFDDNIRVIQLFCAMGKKGFYEKYGFESRHIDAPGMQYAGKRNF